MAPKKGSRLDVSGLTGTAARVVDRMARAKKPSKVTKTFYIDAERYAAFEEACAALGSNASAMVNELIADFLDGLPPKRGR